MLFKIESQIIKTGVYTCAVAVRGLNNALPQENIRTMLHEEAKKSLFRNADYCRERNGGSKTVPQCSA